MFVNSPVGIYNIRECLFCFINCIVPGVVLTLMIDIEDLTLSAHVLLKLLKELGKSD